MGYIITEPVPSSTTYMRCGRGGAGNTFRAPAPSPVSTRISSSTSASIFGNTTSPRRFFSGVGGAGNAHEASERPDVSLDTQFQRIAAREDNIAQTGHCGIGGAGNVYRRKESDASSSGHSYSDDGASSINSQSSRAKLWARITGKE